MTRPRMRAAAVPVVFVVGAILGTAWDQLHVRAGTLAYYGGGLFAGQPWWVPLEFGVAFVAGVLFTSLAGDPAPRRNATRLAATEALWLTGVYAITAFFDRMPWLVFALLCVTLLVRIGPLSTLIMGNAIPAAAIVLIGPLVEAMLIAARVFEYRTSQLGPIPAWLPLLWANGVIFLVRLTEAAIRRFGVRRLAEPATAVLTREDPPPDDGDLGEF